MATLSRRLLSRYTSDQIARGKSIKTLAKQVAAVLVESHRKNQAELLAKDVAWQLESNGTMASAEVTSASPISPNQLNKISNFVKKATKVDKVSINYQIDKSLIGGFRIDTADHSWDKSLRRKLNDIKENARG